MKKTILNFLTLIIFLPVFLNLVPSDYYNYSPIDYKINGSIKNTDGASVKDLLIYAVVKYDGKEFLISNYSDTRKSGNYYLALKKYFSFWDGNNNLVFNTAEQESMEIIIRIADIENNVYQSKEEKVDFSKSITEYKVNTVVSKKE